MVLNVEYEYYHFEDGYILNWEFSGTWESLRFSVFLKGVIWYTGDRENQKFLVKSMYNAITPNIIGTCHKHIWKGKIPPKVKIFVWLMENNAILFFRKNNAILRKDILRSS
jgi:hypothetical protein